MARVDHYRRFERQWSIEQTTAVRTVGNGRAKKIAIYRAGEKELGKEEI